MWQGIIRAAAAGVVLALAAPAGAVIKIDQPIEGIYGTAVAVVVGKVSKVNAGKGVEATVTEVLKGNFAEKTLQIDLAAVPDVAKSAAADAPVILMTGRKAGAMVHLGDTWLAADAGASPAAWKVTADRGPGGGGGFHGRTATLVKVVGELKAGKKPMMTAYEHSSWVGKFDCGNIGAGVLAMRSADVNGDKSADLVVLLAAGVKLYLSTGPRAAFKDATAACGLASAKAGRAAFGDVNGDGKPDLLLDSIWVNGGAKFTASKSGIDLSKYNLLAVALVDATGDKKVDAVAVTKDGKLLVFENPGSPDQLWKAQPPKALWQGGDEVLAAEIADWYCDGTLSVMVTTDNDLYCYAFDGRPRDDFFRLVGQKKESFPYRGKPRHYPLSAVGGFKGMLALDVNGGDGRPDVWVIPGNFGVYTLHLVNAGYGCFAWNTEGSIEKGVAWTPADIYDDGSQELLVVTDKGQLFQIDSPPFYGSNVPAPGGKAGAPVPEPYDVKRGG